MKTSSRRLPAFAVLLFVAACAAHQALPPLVQAPLAEADAAMQAMIDKEQMPGGQLWIEQAGHAPYQRAYGQRALEPQAEALDEATIFDAASLTKAVVTATLVQLLRERGRLDIEAPLQRYLPDCGGADKAGITIRHLLTHSSALPASLPGNGAGDWSGIAAAQRIGCALALDGSPGAQFRYSDLNYILLGIIVAKQAGMPLEQFAQTALFEPMGMSDSGYLPLRRFAVARIAPTQKLDEGRMLRGEVHDPTARKMGGVAGHAGLFTTSADLARFARMLLNGGVMDDGRHLLSSESVRLLTTPQSPAGLPVRSLGWDIDTAYSRPRGKLYPKGLSFGHTGFTGCAFWLDPGSRSFFVLLANRVHPGRPTNTLPLYEQLGTLSAQAAGLGSP
ncbi:serine hydrolase domain-containing protein [Roseateles violae]|uniref:Serine hydrolase domain-containing protein n=1 Tax=Roseateles violae TaxID=3058042 RepID=A0ABT8DWM3_9BURK|nr:serine hydrolase domain-containing protein [Pelomonas sp. PFR6]MDN3922413.1 serine hydrolase domain-containing protein [Pelomonas sp. PFR6]